MRLRFWRKHFLRKCDGLTNLLRAVGRALPSHSVPPNTYVFGQIRLDRSSPEAEEKGDVEMSVTIGKKVFELILANGHDPNTADIGQALYSFSRNDDFKKSIKAILETNSTKKKLDELECFASPRVLAELISKSYTTKLQKFHSQTADNKLKNSFEKSAVPEIDLYRAIVAGYCALFLEHF